MKLKLKLKILSTAALLGLGGWCLLPVKADVSRLHEQRPEAGSQLLLSQSTVTKVLTPEQNNAITERMYTNAWNKGDMAIVDQTIAPGAYDHSPLSTEKGTEGFKKIIQSFRSAMPGLKMTVEDEIYSGDRVAHRWKVQGKHTGAPLFGVPANGKQLTLNGITIVRLKDGKIAERWTMLDQLGLMQQLGLVPATPPAPKK